ncbi:unnamed protein product [Ixodes pacificus]
MNTTTRVLAILFVVAIVVNDVTAYEGRHLKGDNAREAIASGRSKVYLKGE